MRRQRRSSVQVEAAIRAAVLAELADGGYAAVTFEGIARRVGTSKPVLYRRYPDRASMIFDAVRSRGPLGGLQVSTGSLRADLLATLTNLRDKLSRMGSEAYRALIGEARTETLAQAAAMTVDLLPRLQDVILNPARERGELGPLPLAPEVVFTPMRLARDRITFGPLSDDDLAGIVDQIALPLYRTASGLGSTPERYELTSR